jgi:hypothetical protein
MPGFELLVRPVVLPDRRPTPQPVREPPAGDEGMAVIGGSGSETSVSLPVSISGGWSKSRAQEEKRRYDVVKVMNPEDPDQYVIQEVVNKRWMRNQDGTQRVEYFEPVGLTETQAVEIIESNKLRENKHPFVVFAGSSGGPPGGP